MYVLSAYEVVVLNPLTEELEATKGRDKSWNLADQILITHNILKGIPFSPKGERFSTVKWEYNESRLSFQTKSRPYLDLNRKYLSPLSQAVADPIRRSATFGMAVCPSTFRGSPSSKAILKGWWILSLGSISLFHRS